MGAHSPPPGGPPSSPGGPAAAPASAAPSCHAQSPPWPESHDPEGRQAGNHQHSGWGQEPCLPSLTIPHLFSLTTPHGPSAPHLLLLKLLDAQGLILQHGPVVIECLGAGTACAGRDHGVECFLLGLTLSSLLVQQPERRGQAGSSGTQVEGCGKGHQIGGQDRTRGLGACGLNWWCAAR